ncbi:MAG: ZIP family metal transporter, partial [Clostridia bacterium]|nr:ZIP family metal transporter [Clostridia bacterium]
GSITLAAAIAVAFGIGVQNVPEGAAVSLSSRRVLSKKKAFVFGAVSGVVEPIAGFIGFFFAETVSFMLPCFMSFAAGAMVFASVVDLLPDSLSSGKIKTGVGVMLGFALMMSLDVLLG